MASSGRAGGTAFKVQTRLYRYCTNPLQPDAGGVLTCNGQRHRADHLVALGGAQEALDDAVVLREHLANLDAALALVEAGAVVFVVGQSVPVRRQVERVTDAGHFDAAQIGEWVAMIDE